VAVSAAVAPQRGLFAYIVTAVAIHVGLVYAHLPAHGDDPEPFDCTMRPDFTYVQTPELDRDQAIEEARWAGVLWQGDAWYVEPEWLRYEEPAVRKPESWLAEPKPEVRVVLGALATNGPVDRAIVTRFVKRRLHDLARCYRQVLVENTEQRQSVTVEIAVRDDGSVRAARSIASEHPQLAACITSAIRTIAFPAANEPATLVYNLQFVPAHQLNYGRPTW
jgi:hypothetical protein